MRLKALKRAHTRFLRAERAKKQSERLLFWVNRDLIEQKANGLDDFGRYNNRPAVLQTK